MTDRELDALVAEKVMELILCGVRDEWGDGDSYFHQTGEETIAHIPNYSTSIAAAIEVIMKFMHKMTFNGLTHRVTITHEGGVYTVQNRSLERAISECALMARGVEVE